MLVVINLNKARNKQPIMKTKDHPKGKVGDLVLLKNHKKQIWDINISPSPLSAKL